MDVDDPELAAAIAMSMSVAVGADDEIYERPQSVQRCCI